MPQRSLWGTTSTRAREVIINLKHLLKTDDFKVERLEGIGDVLIYVVPFTLMAGITSLWLYFGIILFVLYADAFHKIGHGETKYPFASFLWGNAVMVFVGLWWGRWDLPYTWAFLALTLVGELGFLLFKGRKHYYNIVWQSIIAPMGFVYLLWFPFKGTRPAEALPGCSRPFRTNSGSEPS